jgi:hypothetical protein
MTFNRICLPNHAPCLPELAQSIKKLTRQAYPSAQSSLTSGLALEHFIDAIPDGNLRLRLRESNPKSIHQAFLADYLPLVYHCICGSEINLLSL